MSPWSLEEVAKHSSVQYVHFTISIYEYQTLDSSCWVIINARVYDVTDFLNVRGLYTSRDSTLLSSCRIILADRP